MCRMLPASRRVAAEISLTREFPNRTQARSDWLPLRAVVCSKGHMLVNDCGAGGDSLRLGG